MTTNSKSFGREIETAEFASTDTVAEEKYYHLREILIDDFSIDKQQFKDTRRELKELTKNTLEEYKDNDFDRVSIYVELLEVVDSKDVLIALKDYLLGEGLNSFLIEFHQGTEENTNHIQYTGNDSIKAMKIIKDFATENELSLHHAKNPLKKLDLDTSTLTEEEKEILKLLDEITTGISDFADKYSEEISKLEEDSKEQIEELEEISSEINIEEVSEQFENYKRNRRK